MIRGAVIGCGVIAPTHLRCFCSLPGVEIRRVCDIVPEKAAKLAAEFHLPHHGSDPREIFDDPQIDFVSICTDHASHADLFCAALESGKSVLCEKIPGRTFEDVSRMTEAARLHPGLAAGGVFQHRFEPENRLLKACLDDGSFGQLLFASLNFNCLRTDAYYLADAWRGTKAGEGGGVLVNQAIHSIDLLRFLFGEVKQVCAKTANLAHRGVIETEDSAAFLLEFACGLMAAVTATNGSCVNWRTGLCVSGTQLCLETVEEKLSFADGRNADRVRARFADIVPPELSPGKLYYGSGHPAQLADFADAVAAHRQPAVTIEEAARTAAVVFAVYQSMAEHRWVEVRPL